MKLLWIRASRLRPVALAAFVFFFIYVGYLVRDPDRIGRVASVVGAATATAVEGDADRTFGERFADRIQFAFPDQQEDQRSVVFVVLGALGLLATLERSVRAFGVKPATLLAAMTGSTRMRDLEAKTGFRHRFAEEFDEVTEALKPRDLVIFVDDLDRCRPKHVLDVLEGINFLYSSGRCVIVMGMDPERVIRCVGLGFKEEAEELVVRSSPHTPSPNGALIPGAVTEVNNSPVASTDTGEEEAREKREEFARQYLEKLVNIEVPVPTRDSLSARKWADENGSAPQTRVVDHPRFSAPALAWTGVAALSLILGFLLFPPRGEREGARGVNALNETSPGLSGGNPVGGTRGQDSANTATPSSMPEASTPPPSRGGPPSKVFAANGSRDTEAALGYVLVAGILLAAAVAITRLVNQPDPVVQDSDDFKLALAAWSPYVAQRHKTPRAMKKFKNRVRYYAMRQRPELDRRAWWRRHLDRALGHAPSVSQKKNAIKEHILVALAAMHEVSPRSISDPATFNRFGEKVTACLLDEKTRDDLKYPRELDLDHQTEFCKLTADIRVN